jgi:hypothetical protein
MTCNAMNQKEIQTHSPLATYASGVTIIIRALVRRRRQQKRLEINIENISKPLIRKIKH